MQIKLIACILGNLRVSVLQQASRIIAQLLLAGGSMVARAAVQAYKQAIISKKAHHLIMSTLCVDSEQMTHY